jgi:riboflavin synthase
MFTGIIQEVGRVKSVTKKGRLLAIAITARLSSKLKKGDSISVDGVCLTVINHAKNSFTADIMPETVKKTIISSYKKDTKVNLELPLCMNDRIDGHFVLGHVDGIGKVTGTSDLKIEPPQSLMKFIAYKGSVCINGVSLTVSKKDKKSFQVSLIPMTNHKTNLGSLKKDDKVNIEVDMLCRYLDSIKT